MSVKGNGQWPGRSPSAIERYRRFFADKRHRREEKNKNQLALSAENGFRRLSVLQAVSTHAPFTNTPGRLTHDAITLPEPFRSARPKNYKSVHFPSKISRISSRRLKAG